VIRHGAGLTSESSVEDKIRMPAAEVFQGRDPCAENVQPRQPQQRAVLDYLPCRCESGGIDSSRGYPLLPCGPGAFVGQGHAPPHNQQHRRTTSACRRPGRGWSNFCVLLSRGRSKVIAWGCRFPVTGKRCVHPREERPRGPTVKLATRDFLALSNDRVRTQGRHGTCLPFSLCNQANPA